MLARWTTNHLSYYRKRERHGTLARTVPAHMRAWRGDARLVDAALRAAGIHPVEVVEVAGLEALKRMAAAGVAVVPWCRALPWSATLPREALCALERDAPGNRLLWHKATPPRPAWPSSAT